MYNPKLTLACINLGPVQRRRNLLLPHKSTCTVSYINIQKQSLGCTCRLWTGLFVSGHKLLCNGHSTCLKYMRTVNKQTNIQSHEYLKRTGFAYRKVKIPANPRLRRGSGYKMTGAILVNILKMYCMIVFCGLLKTTSLFCIKCSSWHAGHAINGSLDRSSAPPVFRMRL